MDTKTALEQVEEILKPWAQVVTHPADDRLDVVIAAKDLISAVTGLREGRWGYLSAITGLDKPGAPGAEEQKQWDRAAETEEPLQPMPAEGQIEVLYHYCEGAAIATLRVAVNYSNPVIPSICPVYPSATLYERELIEMFGVEITGTPNTDRLVLPDDWPAGVYPLRKSFTGFESQSPVQEG